jgi:predicted DNA-binding antitoxin AbrB/MazE fold protein
MPQSQTIEAIYENGVLRPLQALEGFAEPCKVKITVQLVEATPHPLLRFAGILSDNEASELRRIIEDEFERIDPNAW